MPLTRHNIRNARVLTAMAIIGGALFVFLLPWYLPESTPSASISYSYGFNNKIACLGVAFTLIGIMVIRLQKPASLENGGALSDLISMEGRAENSKKYRLTFLCVLLGCVAALVGLYETMPNAHWGEYRSFVSRVDLMVLGYRPYADFGFIYGPGMLYPVYWLYAISGGAISVDAAYFTTLLVHWVAGLWLLYYIIGALGGGVNRILVFLCIAATAFNLSLGLNYTILRFSVPLACLIFLHGMLTKKDGAGAVRPGLAAFVLSLASLSLSPEIGITGTLSMAIYFAALVRTPLRRLAWLCRVPVFSLFAAIPIFSVNYFEGVLSRGAGGDAFPIFPTFHVLLLLGAACWILPGLGVMAIRERDAKGGFAAALAVCLGLMLPACLGRCDPAHVFFNGLGIFIFLLAMATRLPNKTVSRSLVIYFAAIYPVLGAVVSWGSRGDFLLPMLSNNRQIAERGIDPEVNFEKWKIASGGNPLVIYGKLRPFQMDVLLLMKYPKIGMPLECGEDMERFVKMSGRYVPEFYCPPAMQLFTQRDIDRKLRDLESMDVLLVPKKYQILLRDAQPDEKTDSEFLQKLLFFPVSFRPTEHWLIPERQVVRAISEEFEFVEQFRDYAIVVRKARK